MTFNVGPTTKLETGKGSRKMFWTSLKFPKWHDLDHLGAYIDFFGSAQSLDRSSCESNFKVLAKKPAKRSNKLRTRINYDVGTDLTHRRLIMAAANILRGDHVHNNDIINDGDDGCEQEDVIEKNSKSSVFKVILRQDSSSIDIFWKKNNVEPLMSCSAQTEMEIYQLLFSSSRGILEVPFSTVEGFNNLESQWKYLSRSSLV